MHCFEKIVSLPDAFVCLKFRVLNVPITFYKIYCFIIHHAFQKNQAITFPTDWCAFGHCGRGSSCCKLRWRFFSIPEWRINPCFNHCLISTQIFRLVKLKYEKHFLRRFFLVVNSEQTRHPLSEKSYLIVKCLCNIKSTCHISLRFQLTHATSLFDHSKRFSWFFSYFSFIIIFLYGIFIP